MLIFLILTIVTINAVTLFFFIRKTQSESSRNIERLLIQEKQNSQEVLEKNIRDLRLEVSHNLNQGLKQIEDNIFNHLRYSSNLQKERLELMEKQQEKLIETTEKRLEEMRVVVEEKIQKTLNERIGQSFKAVQLHLEQVQQGLGEMKNLAEDVGGLKKVLTNVKMRGTFGEVQLGALLEQMLSPEQFDANVKTKRNSSNFVEYAIKLPGKDSLDSHIYLPIDAKFPKDIYEQYRDAYESGDTLKIENTGRQLEYTIKNMAKEIHDKYIDPPYTTDFAILFLPFENIYAEVIRRTSLIETLQREFKITVTGPTTLGAILNSLQMGFRTLAIQKRTSEVWGVLGAVKTEFNKFGELLEKIQRNLQVAGNQLEEVISTRTRAIKRTLREVEQLPQEESRKILPLDDAE
ncbi:MAG: DNA recombination protein RmuC [Bacteroidales bacterium]|nr:DNA recombination protein RmuC [Bacteroidales bacterium]